MTPAELAERDQLYAQATVENRAACARGRHFRTTRGFCLRCGNDAGMASSVEEDATTGRWVDKPVAVG